MRRRVLQKRGSQDEDDDDSDLVGGSEEDDEEPEDGWGKKKKVYWDGDTADLEIGQDIQDAEDEEEAARELGRQQKSKLRDEDFFEDFKGSKKDKSAGTKSGKLSDKAAKTDKLQKALELAASGVAPYEVQYILCSSNHFVTQYR
jgi:U3 small nucleolar RNA-associated protein 3